VFLPLFAKYGFPVVLSSVFEQLRQSFYNPPPNRTQYPVFNMPVATITSHKASLLKHIFKKFKIYYFVFVSTDTQNLRPHGIISVGCMVCI